ncbi:MAG TPA: hypothetical protein VFT12_09265 [Thermoanaerobaculia bacterium]|nr:hypothetical protein [Thermoanaerobaculia bacterium]
MFKKSSAVLVLLLAAACASNPLGSSGGNGGSTSSPALPSLRNAPDYVLLSAPTQVRTYDFGNAIGVKGFHVRGVMTNRGFQPIGEVQGNGKFCEGGQDWLSLADMAVYKAGDTREKRAPYLLGCANGNTFQPASRAIVAQ